MSNPTTPRIPPSDLQSPRPTSSHITIPPRIPPCLCPSCCAFRASLPFSVLNPNPGTNFPNFDLPRRITGWPRPGSSAARMQDILEESEGLEREMARRGIFRERLLQPQSDVVKERGRKEEMDRLVASEAETRTQDTRLYDERLARRDAEDRVELVQQKLAFAEAELLALQISLRQERAARTKAEVEVAFRERILSVS